MLLVDRLIFLNGHLLLLRNCCLENGNDMKLAEMVASQSVGGTEKRGEVPGGQSTNRMARGNSSESFLLQDAPAADSHTLR